MKIKLLIGCNLACCVAIVALVVILSRNIQKMSTMEETISDYRATYSEPFIDVIRKNEREKLNCKIEYSHPRFGSEGQLLGDGVVSFTFCKVPENVKTVQLSNWMAEILKTCVGLYPPASDVSVKMFNGFHDEIDWQPGLFYKQEFDKCFFIDKRNHWSPADKGPQLVVKKGRWRPGDLDYCVESHYSEGAHLSDGTISKEALLDVEYYKEIDPVKVQANLRLQLQMFVDLYDPTSDVIATAWDYRPGKDNAFQGVKTLKYYRDAKKIDFDEARK